MANRGTIYFCNSQTNNYSTLTLIGNKIIYGTKIAEITQYKKANNS
jgi:hypothetical protein